MIIKLGAHMRNQAEYFKENRHVAKYEFGERIFGYWNSIPFVGTIGNDTVIKKITKLIEMEEDVKTTNRKTRS